MNPSPPSGRWRIGAVDDHESTLRGLRSIVDEEPDMTLVADASTVGELLRQTHELDLVILDLRLEDGSSPQTNVEMLRHRDIGVLVYTSGDEPFLVRAASSAGVLGVLRKNVRAHALVNSVREALAGRAVPTIDWAAALDSDPGFVDLSPQLRRVLELYATGESTTGVARTLGLSSETVSDYVDRIRRKYSAVGRPAPTKTDLYKRAIEDGWVPLPRRRRRPS